MIYLHTSTFFTTSLMITIFLCVNKNRGRGEHGIRPTTNFRATFTSKGPAGRRTLQRGGFLARIMFMASHQCKRWCFGENGCFCTCIWICMYTYICIIFIMIYDVYVSVCIYIVIMYFNIYTSPWFIGG